MVTFESLPQFGRKFVEAFLAARLQVHVVQFVLLTELAVAKSAPEVIFAPGLVQPRETVGGDHLRANETAVAKQVMVVDFAVWQAFPLHESTAHEWLSALAASEMLVMPVLAQRRDHALLVLVNRLVAGRTDGHTHLVVASQAVQLAFALFAVLGQLRTAASTREVIGMVGVLAVSQQLRLLHQAGAFRADRLRTASRLDRTVAAMTERQTAILDETLVGEVLAANRTVEAVRMVAAIDRLYHTSVDPLLAN